VRCQIPAKGDHGNITAVSCSSAATGISVRSARACPSGRTIPNATEPRTTPSRSRCSCGRVQTTAASARDCRTAWTASSPGLDVTKTLRPGMARPTVRRGPSRTRSAIVQIRRVTCSRLETPADGTSSSARSTSARITRARSARRRPEGVSSAPRDVRSKSVTRKSRSSARICCESDGAEMCNRRAAAANRRSSATVRKYLSCRRSTGHATARNRDRAVVPLGPDSQVCGSSSGFRRWTAAYFGISKRTESSPRPVEQPVRSWLEAARCR
jgi:hypothetical protein